MTNYDKNLEEAETMAGKAPPKPKASTVDDKIKKAVDMAIVGQIDKIKEIVAATVKEYLEKEDCQVGVMHGPSAYLAT